MLVSNVESRRAFALIDALEGCEITTSEFSDAIRALSSEALQVTAAVLDVRTAYTLEELPRLRMASRLCRQLAHAARVLS